MTGRIINLIATQQFASSTDAGAVYVFEAARW